MSAVPLKRVFAVGRGTADERVIAAARRSGVEAASTVVAEQQVISLSAVDGVVAEHAEAVARDDVAAGTAEEQVIAGVAK